MFNNNIVEEYGYQNQRIGRSLREGDPPLTEAVKSYLRNPGEMEKKLLLPQVETYLFPFLINSDLVNLSKALYGRGDDFLFELISEFEKKK